MNRFVTASLVALVLLSFTGSAGAAVIVIGDFETPDPFAGWTTDTTFSFAPPSGVGGVAKFEETTVGTQLQKTFALPENAISLSFEFLLEALGTPTATPLDSFQATLWDDTGSLAGLFASDPLDPESFPAFYSIDNDGTQYFDPIDPNGGSGGSIGSIGTFVTIEGIGGGFKKITLDVSSLLPMQTLTIDFLLNGSDDGVSTTVSLDNVVLTTRDPSVVPESCSLATWGGLSLLTLVMTSRRRRNRSARRA